MITVLKCLFWAALAVLVVTAPALWRAYADPNAVPYAVCAELGADPTIFNVTRVLEEVAAYGLTTIQASTVVVDSVQSTCPQYLPLLRRFIDEFGPQQGAGSEVRDRVIA